MSYTTNPPSMSYATNSPSMSYATQYPSMSYATQPPRMSHATQPPKMSYATQYPSMSYATQLPRMSNATNSPRMSNATQLPRMSNATNPPSMSNTTNPPRMSYATQPPKMSNAGHSDAFPEFASDTSEPETSPFDDQIVRRAFVRKVFGIQILTLLFAFGVVCLFTFLDVVKEWVRGDLWIYTGSIIAFFSVIIILCFLLCMKEHHPWNFVGLVLVTLSFSFMLGTTASFFNTYSVLIGLGETMLIFLAIIAFNAQNRIVFNMCFGFIMIVALLLLILGIMYGIFRSNNPAVMLDVIIGGTGAFLVSMLFMIQVQVMTWRKKDRVGPQEYVTAAVFLYLDMVLFIGYIREVMCCMGSYV